jgi:hypothetical protein
VGNLCGWSISLSFCEAVSAAEVIVQRALEYGRILSLYVTESKNSKQIV